MAGIISAILAGIASASLPEGQIKSLYMELYAWIPKYFLLKLGN